MATVAETQALPSLEDLETAEDAIGTYLSELDVLRMAVERQTAPMTMEEYRRLEAAGTLKAVDRLRVSDDQLYALIAFTADALQDGDSIRKTAKRVQAALLAELHDRRNQTGHGDPNWIAYQERRRAWHLARAAKIGAAHLARG